MIIVVDTNIVISALITPNSKLARLLTHNNLPAKRISSHILIKELSRHHNKIARLCKRSFDAVANDIYAYLQHITLYEETVILPEYWQEADRFTKDVDADDIASLPWHCKLAEYYGRATKNYPNI
ncbi:hypothetical protein BH09BAC6_BH09BAC6_23750 [soil metagenome]|jgi:predicted nucleic acid-binding protein